MGAFAPIGRNLTPNGRRKIVAGAGRKNTKKWAHFYAVEFNEINKNIFNFTIFYDF